VDQQALALAEDLRFEQAVAVGGEANQGLDAQDAALTDEQLQASIGCATELLVPVDPGKRQPVAGERLADKARSLGRVPAEARVESKGDEQLRGRGYDVVFVGVGSHGDSSVSSADPCSTDLTVIRKKTWTRSVESGTDRRPWPISSHAIFGADASA